MPGEQSRKTPLYLRRIPLGWEIAIDIAVAVGVWCLSAANAFPALVTWGVPIAYILIAVPLAIWRSKKRARSNP